MSRYTDRITKMNGFTNAASTRLAPAVFGDRSGALVSALSAASGLRGTSSINLVAVVVSLMLALLKRLIAENVLDAQLLATMLGDQGPHLYGALDRRLTEALGYSGPAAYFGRLGGEAAVMARRVASRGATATPNEAATTPPKKGKS